MVDRRTLITDCKLKTLCIVLLRFYVDINIPVI